jgi:hypothetical protein
VRRPTGETDTAGTVAGTLVKRRGRRQIGQGGVADPIAYAAFGASSRASHGQLP